MNKTVNINLAGTFFHIDEDAFGKLSRYLEAIKKSLLGTEGSEEIMRDIEARMAELFSERLESNAQVITLKELDEVISIMGQPEDYQVDEEIFEETPPRGRSFSKGSATHKQLFRDIDDKYISGVSSGLGHYIGVDAIWIRLLWVLLVFAGFGSPILIYILLWIFVPPAETTSEKLKMRGEPINISNIERKFKEGFGSMADKIKSADYGKFEKRMKSGTAGFFDSLGNLIVSLFRIFGKLIGILIIVISLCMLIGLIVSAFTFGSVGFWGNSELMYYVSMVDTTNTPFWLFSLLVFLAVGIPFFALFILGLKLLISNLKPMGSRAKITLLALWLLSIIGLGILGVRQATEKAYDAETVTEELLPIKTGDTLRLSMRGNAQYDYSVTHEGGLEIKYDENNQKIIYSNDIQLVIRSTKDSIAKLLIEKNAGGHDYLDAKKRAEAIVHNHLFENGTLYLDGYFTTGVENKFRDQEIQLTLFLPEGTVFFGDENTYSFHQFDHYFKDIFVNGEEGRFLKIIENGTECLDCPESTSRDGQAEENWEKEVIQDLETSKPDSLQTKTIDSIN